MVQSVGTLPTTAAEAIVVPFMNQIATSPVVVLRHRMSALPSPLKSPMPSIVQAVGTLPKPPLDEIDAPFISQTATLPLLSRHRRSPLPSPLKSPVPAIVQLV